MKKLYEVSFDFCINKCHFVKIGEHIEILWEFHFQVGHTVEMQKRKNTYSIARRTKSNHCHPRMVIINRDITQQLFNEFQLIFEITITNTRTRVHQEDDIQLFGNFEKIHVLLKKLAQHVQFRFKKRVFQFLALFIDFVYFFLAEIQEFTVIIQRVQIKFFLIRNRRVDQKQNRNGNNAEIRIHFGVISPAM